MATTLERTHQRKMADLSLPPEEHGGDDGKVTSAVHTIRKDSWWLGLGGGGGGLVGGFLTCINEAVKIPRPRQSVPYPLGKLQVNRYSSVGR